jgi:hypothetical protein
MLFAQRPVEISTPACQIALKTARRPPGNKTDIKPLAKPDWFILG